MRAAGALPTEQRVRDMNDAQWLWYYMNIQKDLEEDRDRAENYLDYMGSWVNPELAKSVFATKDRKKKSTGTHPVAGTVERIDENTEIEWGDTAVSDTFEDELRRALADAGVEDEFTEIPDGSGAGDPYMSQEDFLAQVMQLQEFAQSTWNQPEKQDEHAILVDSINPLSPTKTIQNAIPYDQYDLDIIGEEDD